MGKKLLIKYTTWTRHPCEFEFEVKDTLWNSDIDSERVMRHIFNQVQEDNDYFLMEQCGYRGSKHDFDGFVDSVMVFERPEGSEYYEDWEYIEEYSRTLTFDF